MSAPRIIISGGGTGGHIFPAIAIANRLKELNEKTEILFIGAQDRMEMEKVPNAGYNIEGLWISGFQRSLNMKNLSFPFKLIASIMKSKRLIKKFRPDAIVGVGGYSSGPVLYNGTKLKIPTLIQEQNSFPGITNRMLANKVDRICVAYDNMSRFFPDDKMVNTGNPIRKGIANIEGKREEGLKHFGLNPNLKTLLILGGSLGARSINEGVQANIDLLYDNNVQVIWQTGSGYFDAIDAAMDKSKRDKIKVQAFIDTMELAYAACDIVVSRAGAITISELCAVGKSTILIPSPNVSEDHQTKNAQALVAKDAAIMVKDKGAIKELGTKAIELITDNAKMKSLSENIKLLAKLNSTEKIVEELLNLIKN